MGACWVYNEADTGYQARKGEEKQILKTISSIEIHAGSREELLPDFAPDFPYIASHAEFVGRFVPWHWHKAVELFYMQSGALER